jgi:hypothetical protein
VFLKNLCFLGEKIEIFYTTWVFVQELVEWARQAWRWQIGCAEIFHYFLIKSHKITFLSAVRYGLTFTHYYAFFLCTMALFAVCSLISTNLFNSLQVCTPANYLPSIYLTYLPECCIGFAYVLFGYFFIIDRFVVNYLLDNVHENISILRNVVHFVSTPFVLVAYSCITYYALFELAIRGKQVCTHGASKKTGLVWFIFVSFLFTNIYYGILRVFN